MKKGIAELVAKIGEAHKSVKQIQQEFYGMSPQDTMAIEAVNCTLYLAEGYFVSKEDAPDKGWPNR